jgi:hypothetical protein
MIPSECHEFKTKQCNSRTETTPVSASQAVRPSSSKAGFHCRSFQHGDGTGYEAWRHWINVTAVTQYVYTQTNKSVLRGPTSTHKNSDLVTKAMEILQREADPLDTGCCSHISVHCRRRVCWWCSESSVECLNSVIFHFINCVGNYNTDKLVKKKR